MDTAESRLENTLQYRFKDAELLQLALTHRSAAGQSNERLEFLGDAVLNVVISESLYHSHPAAPEGDLSKLRSSLVKDDSLAELALELELGEHLILGSGERRTGGHHRRSILADALEAIFGAVFLDRGMDAARDVISTVFAARLRELPNVADLRDPKTRLQEWLQARKMQLPTYALVRETGKDHRKRFEVSCSVAGAPVVTYGESTTRRKAEQMAARQMLEKIAEQQQ